jgi:KDO2-lipid IV(A) lauroyltransferase
MKERFVTALYLAAWYAVPRLPERWAESLFRLFADIAWRRQGIGVQRLEANLLRVEPAASGKRLRALSRAGMRSYMRYWMETFRLPTYDRDRVVGSMTVQNWAAVETCLESGRGALLALPHMGNWDHAGAWVAMTGTPFTTVVERLHPDSLFERFLAHRRGLGMEVLPHTGSGLVAGTLARRLRDGGLVCLPADRDLNGSGVEITLFGEPALLAGGPAVLAMRTGAALFPVTLWFTEEGPDGEPPGWVARVHDEVPVPGDGDRTTKAAAMTQALADVFTAGIAAHPQDWHMLQPIFLADLAAAEPGAGVRA